MLEKENEPRTETDEETVVESLPKPSLSERLMGQAPANGPAKEQSRPNLTDRLMSQTSGSVSPPTTQTQQESTSNTSAPRSPSGSRVEPAASRNGVNRSSPNRVVTSNLGVSPPMLSDSLHEARRYIFLRYMIFLASVAMVFVVAVVVGIILLGSLLADTDWKNLVIIGAIEALAIILLVFLQYRPPRSFGSAASQVAQLEATRTQLSKSFEFWERYLNERPEDRPVTANEVALAVSSLADACNALLDTGSGTVRAQAPAKGVAPPVPPPSPTQPSRPSVSSNPRRY